MLKSEKEILTDFAFLVMSECGLAKFMPENKGVWLKFPTSGIRQGINDLLVMTSDLDPAKLKELDVKLDVSGLPTLTKMRQKNFKKTLQILSREKVKNENEWRLLRSEVEIGSYKPEELKKMQELLDAFEFENS